MTKINSIVAGGCFPTPSPQPTLPSPTLPRPEPLPLPFPKPGVLDKFLTPARSQQLANTQGRQLDSIQQGLKNGSLTEQEASKLLGQQAQIAEATARAGSDGVISAQEAANIRLMQLKAGLDTFLASHNSARGTPGDAVAKEQAAQIGRIASGVRSGSLTGAEANTLLTDQADIAQTVADARSDGEVDFVEEQMVNIRQDAASFEIGLEKRDGEKAPHAKRLNFPVLF
jgi:tellurite resistance protein